MTPTFVASAAAAQAAPPAAAPAEVRVHLHADRPVLLKQLLPGARGAAPVLCASPCDAPVPAAGRVFVDGPDVRASAPFSLRAEREQPLVLEVRTAPRELQGVTALFVGGLFTLFTGIGVTGYAFGCNPSNGCPKPPGIGVKAAGIGALGLGVGAVVGGTLWDLSTATRVTQASSAQRGAAPSNERVSLARDEAAAAIPERVEPPMPTTFSVPVVSFRF